MMNQIEITMVSPVVQGMQTNLFSDFKIGMNYIIAGYYFCNKE